MADELLFTVQGAKAHPATPISLGEAGLKERQDLQEWVLEFPRILGDGVMVVTFEFDRWWASTGSTPLDRLDVLGLDLSGRLVVGELKRDKAPETTEMQAIKYAAMVSRFTLKTLAEQHAKFLTSRGTPCDEEEALTRLTTFAEDLALETLAKPRIVLVAGEFPPVVTATTVWLNEMGVDVTLMKYQAYRTDTETLLSVSQLYPVPTVEDFTVSPRQAEARAQADTKKRTQDTSAVRRLVEAGAIEDGATFRLRTRTEVNAEVREAIDAWLDEDAARATVHWQNKAAAPLVWDFDGAEYTPSGLVKKVIHLTSGIDRSVQGTKWFIDSEGRDLVELSASGKRSAYLAFWTRFLERLRDEHPDWSKAEIPQPDSWFTMPAPIKGAVLGVSFAHGGRLRSELYLGDSDEAKNLAAFRALEDHKAAIEDAFGGPLSWEELPGKQSCRVAAYGEGDASNLSEHDAYIDWFFDTNARLRAAVQSFDVTP